MDQGQAAPLAHPAAATAPPVLPTPPPPPLAIPSAPSPPALPLEPEPSHAVLNFDDPNTRATATKLYNKAIALSRRCLSGKPTIWPFS